MTSSHAKKQTAIIYENEISEQGMKKVISDAGYDFVSMSSELYERKGLFGVRK